MPGAETGAEAHAHAVAAQQAIIPILHCIPVLLSPEACLWRLFPLYPAPYFARGSGGAV
jgi:hypothetical protein